MRLERMALPLFPDPVRRVVMTAMTAIIGSISARLSSVSTRKRQVLTKLANQEPPPDVGGKMSAAGGGGGSSGPGGFTGKYNTSNLPMTGLAVRLMMKVVLATLHWEASIRLQETSFW